MAYVPDPGSIDAEAFKPLQYKIEEEEEWRGVTESEVLEAYRGATVPSTTLFRRGEDGHPRTLATLITWNGRECPFADFSEPERREGGREKSRRHNGSGDAVMDENENCVQKGEGRGGERVEELHAVFTRFVAYMDQIQERMTSIEKHHTEQQNKLAGADVFMKKVASLEMRVGEMEKTLAVIDKRTAEVHDFVFFSKRAPIGQSGKPSSMHAAELDEQFDAAKKMYAEALKRSEELRLYKEEVQKVHSLSTEVDAKLGALDDRYGQLMAMLAANERNEDVREAIEEWNEKQKELKQQRAESAEEMRATTPVMSLPRRPLPVSTVNRVEKLDLNNAHERAVRERMQQQLRQTILAIPNRTVAEHVMGLLMGRERPATGGDVPASPTSVHQLCQLSIDMRGSEISRLSIFMEEPRYHCFCGAHLQTGNAVIGHFNTSKHVAKRQYPVYQFDVNFWISIIIKIKSGQSIQSLQSLYSR